MKEMDPDVEEHLQGARSELKRVDHLIYVSLKYTRTVDVIRNTVSRIISTYDLGVLALLADLKAKKKISDLPSSPGMKVELLQKKVTDDYLNESLEFYLLLRKLMKLDYTKREEYRRHVTMITILDNNTNFEIDIDKLEDYYKKTKEFINHLTNIITGKKDD
jgi:hypothetical protein